MIEDEDLLMAVLNSAPVDKGVRTDQLEDPTGSELIGRFGGLGTAAERSHLQGARDALHALLRAEADAAEALAPSLSGVALTPAATDEGIQWQLDAPDDRRLAARVVLAWSRVLDELPGRLRACANTECNLFLLDHSRPGTAKWCSMATCGNRMKARTYARRDRRS
ncbi:CGNR zinc finger domain-containing protein [Brachybacterium sp. AOP43-C2-M15]|uniref:CGNR zinc finger domain-containing protein n=1 Tax=Brachybacterium sp. AOP43-C2-M15 TaxID=3457661 RepID=UPI004033DA8B